MEIYPSKKNNKTSVHLKIEGEISMNQVVLLLLQNPIKFRSFDDINIIDIH